MLLGFELLELLYQVRSELDMTHYNLALLWWYRLWISMQNPNQFASLIMTCNMMHYLFKLLMSINFILLICIKYISYECFVDGVLVCIHYYASNHHCCNIMTVVSNLKSLFLLLLTSNCMYWTWNTCHHRHMNIRKMPEFLMNQLQISYRIIKTSTRLYAITPAL